MRNSGYLTSCPTNVPISGPVEMDHEQMAAELTEALGRKIVFQDLPIDEYCRSLEAMGVPPCVVNISAARWMTTNTVTCLGLTTTSRN